MRRHFRILGLELTLAGPAELIDPIAFAYRRFAVERAPAGAVEIVLDPEEPEVLRIDGRRIDLIPGLDRTAQIYQGFLDLVMDRLGSHALLHAAALVEPGGGALLLAAPSGHGKSSLAIEMVRRGFGFLGDDYAPVDLERGLVHPYHRAMGLTAESAARIADCAVLGPALMGKRLADVGDWLGEGRLARRPAPLAHVVLLAASLAAPSVAPATTLRLASREADADGLDAVFAATPGVEVAQRHRERGLATWRLTVDPRCRPAGELSWVLESDRVLFVEKCWEDRPDFSEAPALSPVPRREAAELLGRELLNRRGGGRLLARHGGSVVSLFVALAGALRGADCYRLRVGARGATAELLDGLIRGFESRKVKLGA